MTDGLTEKQKELFEDYMTARREVIVLIDCETFYTAFMFGTKVLPDVLTAGKMKEIETWARPAPHADLPLFTVRS